MQSTLLFQRNTQKLQSFLWRRLRIRRYFCSGPGTRGKYRVDNSCSESGNSSSDDSIKVTVMGAAGRVGRTLSLLLKTSPLVDDLCMFDIDSSVKGYCLDISHIDTKCSVNYVCGMSNVQDALDDPNIVLIAAGSPSSPTLNDKKLFRKNAPVVAALTRACAKFCPEACIVLITSPINSLLPVAGEVYELVTGEKPAEKLFGLTTLDVVRANTFTAEAIRCDPSKVIVPVIGGTSEETIVPVISQMKPCCKIKHEEVIALTECVKQAEGSLTDCQNCGTRGSSSLSTAYAAFRFSSSLISALKGSKNVVDCAYVQSDILPELEYMASPLKLGTCGIEYNYGYPKLSDYEVALMENGAIALRTDIEMGKLYVSENKATIFKSLKNGFDIEDDAESHAKTCKIHDVVEISEPVEAVSLTERKSLGGEKSGIDSIVKSGETNAGPRHSSGLSDFTGQMIGGCSAMVSAAPAQIVLHDPAVKCVSLSEVRSGTEEGNTEFLNVRSVISNKQFKRLFHTRNRGGTYKYLSNSLSPYCPARHPDNAADIKYKTSLLADEKCVRARKVNIEETKQKIREYYKRIKELEIERTERENGEEEERRECLGLDTKERHRRVKRKLLRTRRERLKLEANLLQKPSEIGSVVKVEGLMKEVDELKRKNEELLAKMFEMESVRRGGVKVSFLKSFKGLSSLWRTIWFGSWANNVTPEKDAVKINGQSKISKTGVNACEGRKNAPDGVKYPCLGDLPESGDVRKWTGGEGKVGAGESRATARHFRPPFSRLSGEPAPASSYNGLA